MPSLPPIFLPEIRLDIQDVVLWSEDHFGATAADRYATLIAHAFINLQADPTRPGSKARSDLSPGAYVYHLMYSRDRVPGRSVKIPRHFILYRIVGGKIEFARLLHDSRDLALHLPGSYARD